MKRNHKIVAGVAAVFSLAVATAVYAHPGGGMGRGGMGMGPMGGMYGQQGAGRMAGAYSPAALAESRLNSLKAELKITAEQESVWQTFTAAAKQQSEAMQAVREKMPATSSTAAERMDQRTALTKQRASGMDSMSSALKDLYAALSPEQKAVADKSIGSMGAGGRAMAFNRFGR